jgi:IS5 family transposase
MLMEIFETRKLVKHLKKRTKVIKKLGFKKMPSKRTLDRWKLKHEYELEQVIQIVGDGYLQLSESEWTILDSTPIVDEDDPEATVGHNSKGEFIGFKLHMSCDEYEVPLRATFTQAHVHDSQKAKQLLALTKKAGGDCAYDFKELRDEAKQQGTKLITSHNPRRKGKKAKKPTPKILKKVRIIIEQCNGFIKSQVMKHAWDLFTGLKAKATFCLTAVLAIQALAIYNLKRFDYPSIRIAELRV